MSTNDNGGAVGEIHHAAQATTTVYFGPRWDAPGIDYARPIPTPVGEPCLNCEEPIVEGDRGVRRAVIRLGDKGQRVEYAIRHVHMECDLRMALGSPAHLLGLCCCHSGNPAHEPRDDRPPRAQALAVLEIVNQWRARRGMAAL